MTRRTGRRSSPSCAVSTRPWWPSTTTRPWWRRCGRCASATPNAELLFCNGGDRSDAGDPVPSAETQLAEEIGLQMVYGVGGEDKSELEQPDQRGAQPVGRPSRLPALHASVRRAAPKRARPRPGAPAAHVVRRRTGERVELSVATYANWVAKAASLLVEEQDLERGDVLLVDLPSHWLGPVFLGAAWTAGLAVAFPSSGSRRTPSCADPRPGRRGRPAPTTCRCSRAPCCPWAFASPSRCPPGCTTSASRCGDSRTRSRRTTRLAGRRGARGRLGDPRRAVRSSVAAGSSQNSTGGDRLLSTANPASPPGVAAVREPLVTGGSLVLVAGASGPARRDRRGRAGHPPLGLMSRRPATSEPEEAPWPSTGVLSPGSC